MPALRIKSARHRIDRAARLVLMALALLLVCAPAGQAEPLTVSPASTSWERVDPTLELPRVYNPDGTLPPDAEMPGAALMPEASPETALPQPDAIEPSSASAPSASAPAFVHGDPATGGGHDTSATRASAANDDDESAVNPSMPEPDPESVLSAPSTLDPTDGIDIQELPDSRAGERR